MNRASANPLAPLISSYTSSRRAAVLLDSAITDIRKKELDLFFTIVG